MCELWMAETRTQAAWDARLERLPRCRDCKKPITDEKCLPVADGLLCPKCVGWRMVEVESLG